MFTPRIRAALLVASASLGLGACGYGPYGGTGVSVGYGYGNGYGAYGSPYYGSGYGYGSPYYGAGYGYGSPYYGSRYGSPYYGGGYGYPSYYGWNNNFYYPGVGYYVYRSDGSRHRWSDAQRRYWESRRTQANTNQVRENWDGFRRDRTQRQRVVEQPVRVSNVSRPRSVERQTVRAERKAERAERRTTSQSRQSDRRDRRNDRRDRD